MRHVCLLFLLLMLTASAVYSQTNNGINRRIVPNAPASGMTDASRSAISDAGFEMGSPNPHWAESSIHFGSPICNSACGLAAHTGENYAWFGGVSDALEVATLEQDIVISAETTTLSFYLLIGANGGQGNMSVWLDSNEVATFSEADSPQYSTYKKVSISLPNLADGQPHRLRFYGVTYPGGTTNFLVDSISLEPTPLAVTLVNTKTSSGKLPELFQAALLTAITASLYIHKRYQWTA